MSIVYVAFRENDTSLTKNDLSLDICKRISDGVDIVSSSWDITQNLGRGVYKIDIPETLFQVFVSFTVTSLAPLVVKWDGFSEGGTPATIDEIEDLLVEKAATAEAIRQEIDANSTQLALILGDTNEIQQKLDIMTNGTNVFTAAALANTPSVQVVGGIGDGQVLFKWYEYEQGHQNDPAYAVPGVICAVYANEDATGQPEASNLTDETGCALMWLNEGVYYLFRRKSGRSFVNPIRITVTHVQGDSVEEDSLALNYIQFTWYEYEDGHEGDPAYVIVDVDVRMFTNIAGTGNPYKTARTDENGMAEFWVPADTYYLFRSKVGRTFTNPVTIEVS